MKYCFSILLWLASANVISSRLAGSAVDIEHSKNQRRLNEGAFIESSGLIVMEAESAPEIPEVWKREAYVAGYTGVAYLRFNGNTVERGPPNGTISYPFQISNPGVYQLSLRANKNHTDPTQSNDCYTRLLMEDGSTTEFTKTYARGTPNFWTWSTNWELDTGNHPVPMFNLAAGWYALQIAGRSKNYVLDRVVLFDPSRVAEPLAEWLQQPESDRVESEGRVAPQPVTAPVPVPVPVTVPIPVPVPNPIPVPVSNPVSVSNPVVVPDTVTATALLPLSSTFPSFFIDAGDENEDESAIGGEFWMSRFPAEITGVPPPYSIVASSFKTHRSGTAFTYTLPGFEANTDYAVTLGWAENYVVACRTGRRIFNVTVNQVPFVTFYDVFTEAQGCNRAVLVSKVMTTDSNGEFFLNFTSDKQNPMVSVIGIEPFDATTTTVVSAVPPPPLLMPSPVVAPQTNAPVTAPLTTAPVATAPITAAPVALPPPQTAAVSTPISSYLEDIVLIDTSSNSELASLNDGDVLDLSALPSTLSVIVKAPSDVTRVRFQYLGLTETEGRRPFTMAGKSGQGINEVPALATSGSFVTVITLYGAMGQLETIMLTLSVEDSTSTTFKATAKTLPPDGIFIDSGSPTEAQSHIFGNTWPSVSDMAISGVPSQYEQLTLQSHLSGQAPFGYLVTGFEPEEMVEITLGFAETNFCEVGSRVFDILVNDLSFMPSLDVFGTAGCNSALMLRGKTSATADGSIEVKFLQQVQNPMVSFVSIVRTTESSVTADGTSAAPITSAPVWSDPTIPTALPTDTPSTAEPALVLTNSPSRSSSSDINSISTVVVVGDKEASSAAPSTSAPVSSNPTTTITTPSPTTAPSTAGTSLAPTNSPSRLSNSDITSSPAVVAVEDKEPVQLFSPQVYIDAGSLNDTTDAIRGDVWASSTDNEVTGVPRGMSMGVFQTHRTGQSPFVYRVQGFEPFALANVTLGFAEVDEPNCETGKRVMSVDINQVPVLSNIDVFDMVGCFASFVVSGVFQASATGEFDMTFSAIEQRPMVSLIGIDPLPSERTFPLPGAGTAEDNFFSEAYSMSPSSVLVVSSTDDLGSVGTIIPNTTRAWTFAQDILNVPPGLDPEIFKTHRAASSFSYVLVGFAPFQLAEISMGFAENYVPNCVTSKRMFDVEVNQKEFQYDLDVFGTVGCSSALVITKQFTADAAGTFKIDFFSVKRDPFVSFIAVDTDIGTTTPVVSPEVAASSIPSSLPCVASSIMPTSVPSDSPTVSSSGSPSVVAPSTMPVSQSSLIRAVTSQPSATTPFSSPIAVPLETVTPSFQSAPVEPATEFPTSQSALVLPTTWSPTSKPTSAESMFPSVVPSLKPSSVPSTAFSGTPSSKPSSGPSVTISLLPTLKASSTPSITPTSTPTNTPSLMKTSSPTDRPVILNIALVNALTRETIMSLEEGSTYDITQVGPDLSILVETSSIGFVRFQYDNQMQTEGRLPYVLGGKDGALRYWPVPYLAEPGLKTILVNAFHEDNYIIQRLEMSFTAIVSSNDNSVVTPDAGTPDADGESDTDVDISTESKAIGANGTDTIGNTESTSTRANTTNPALEPMGSGEDMMLEQVFIDAGSTSEDTSVIEGKNWASIAMNNISGAQAPYSMELFKSHRSGYIFNYTIMGFEPNSTALVSIGFAENYEPYCVAGMRVFNVVVNGQVFASNFDAFATAKECFTAVVVTKQSTANSDGGFLVEFRPIRGNPMVSVIAIEVGMEIPAPTYLKNVSLVRAGDRSIVVELFDGSSYDGTKIVEGLSLVVDAVEEVEKVRFRWDGMAHTEGNEPFSMEGKLGSSQFVTVPYLSYPGMKTIYIDMLDTDNQVLESRKLTFYVDGAFFSEASASEKPMIINAGTEEEDQSMMGGSVWSSYFPDNITNVPEGLDMEYLKYHRSGYIFNYTFGGYDAYEKLDLTLVFAENYKPNCVDNKRIFDVDVSGTEFAHAVDVHAAVGCYSGYSISKTVHANSDGVLVIEFLPVKRHPMVSVIRIASAYSSSELSEASTLSDFPSLVPSDAPSMVPSSVPSPPSANIPASQATSMIAGYFLVDAATRSPLSVLAEGDVVSLSGLRTTSLTVVVDVRDVQQQVSHVRFRWDNGKQKTEGRSPYAMNGKHMSSAFNPVEYLATTGMKVIMVEVFNGQTLLEAGLVVFQMVD